MRNWIQEVLVIATLITLAGCSLKQSGGGGSSTAPTSGPTVQSKYDPNATAATNINPFRSAITRISSMLGNSEAASGRNPVGLAITQTLSNLPPISDPTQIAVQGIVNETMLAHGYCAQASSDNALLRANGLNPQAPVAGQTPALVNFAMQILARGTGLSPQTPPSAVPNLFPAAEQIVVNHVGALVTNGATFQQTVSSVCLVMMLASLQIY